MSEITLPYSTPIFTKLGTTVTAGGLPSSDPDSFQFDLFTTLDDEGVALNITTQFTDDDGSVVMNSRQDGKWGQEETANSFPFKKGMNFVLAIVTTAQEYTIVVNDEILYSFRLRSPLETVKRYGISQKANKDDASLKISSVATNDQLINEQVVYLTSRVTNDNLKLTKDGKTVATGGGTGDKAQFMAHREDDFVAGVSLQNMKFRDKYLAIRNDRLLAEKKSQFSYFETSETDDSHFILESIKYSGHYIGVNLDGTIATPSTTGRSIKAQFYFSSELNPKS
ncbi:galectin-9-like [Corticium candelabrum]|uniref:galectin-9-like n=1 Tax=Corticium candelabrum TaxID=121492 RepID=UPI002E2632D1|nr:galectin-9-like [Corticium candelabrum]